MYRIRFHGRGGQGMKTASRILGTAFFLEGLEVQDAPRYGAECRGAPIFAYVRASRSPINERGIIRCPDLVIIADDSLVTVPAAGVLAGVTDQTFMLVSTSEKAVTWSHRLNFAGSILTLPTPVEITDRMELRFVGATCAGAAARLCGIITSATLEQAVREELTGLPSSVIERNLEKALEGYTLMAEHEGCIKEKAMLSAEQYEVPEWINLPFEKASISAPVIHSSLTSELMPTGLWRTMRPVIDREHCKKCWWICSTSCPDGAIDIDADNNPQIDYEHCKGCLTCVTVCPSHAIQAIPEHKNPTSEETGS